MSTVAVIHRTKRQRLESVKSLASWTMIYGRIREGKPQDGERVFKYNIYSVRVIDIWHGYYIDCYDGFF